MFSTQLFAAALAAALVMPHSTSTGTVAVEAQQCAKAPAACPPRRNRPAR